MLELRGRECVRTLGPAEREFLATAESVLVAAGRGTGKAEREGGHFFFSALMGAVTGSAARATSQRRTCITLRAGTVRAGSECGPPVAGKGVIRVRHA